MHFISFSEYLLDTNTDVLEFAMTLSANRENQSLLKHTKACLTARAFGLQALLAFAEIGIEWLA
jgi:hypothetical protein